MVDDVILFDHYVNDVVHLGPRNNNNIENNGTNFVVHHGATNFEVNGVSDQDSIECVAIDETRTESSSKLESESMCCICLGDLSNGSKMTQPCSHVFHQHCINKWFNISKTCPLCRRAIN
ncbi:probable E3 ubiquitin-protein ligase RHY1A [Cicer arietinum]|uniref:RING-type E3 ubiquitin transferase n=1 Tax=Cicer arietinum TaxID=3827 RepID=A0A1S2YVU4_CICAR|nr:RING-H2 finger protein ATL66-like [Cicer arietinum]